MKKIVTLFLTAFLIWSVCEQAQASNAAIDPDGASINAGSSMDPNDSNTDSGGSIDPNGTQTDTSPMVDPNG